SCLTSRVLHSDSSFSATIVSYTRMARQGNPPQFLRLVTSPHGSRLTKNGLADSERGGRLAHGVGNAEPSDSADFESGVARRDEPFTGECAIWWLPARGQHHRLSIDHRPCL